MITLPFTQAASRLAVGLFGFAILLTSPSSVTADPCGMVPPVSVARGAKAIIRTGLQKTYVFHHAEIETFIIHPGFRGNVKSFGMLIPFPSVPAIRKVPDDVFLQIERSIDPPEVIVDLRPGGSYPGYGYGGGYGGGGYGGMGGGMGGYGGPGMEIAKDETRVVREEAVGMYDVAVLRAGSSAALERWMDDNQYRFPTGMDEVCNDYIDAGWCFVAVRARIAQKSLVDPAAGKTTVDIELQAGTHFDGHVQAMGFRFESEQMVVPMRLSTYNDGDLRNIVYALADEPLAINNIDTDFVVRQIAGEDLLQTLTGPLPVRLIGGSTKDIPSVLRQVISGQRKSDTLLGFARDLYASDLSCARRGELSNERESLEKQFLNISERLGLRGDQVDRLHRVVASELHSESNEEQELSALKDMTLTVIDGDFPRDVLARENLTFQRFEIASDKNSRSKYCVPLHGPVEDKEGGELIFGKLTFKPPAAETKLPAASVASAQNMSQHRHFATGLFLLAMAGVALPVRLRLRPLACAIFLAAFACVAAGPRLLAQSPAASRPPNAAVRQQLLEDLGNAEKAGKAADQLAELGDLVCRDLAAAASGPDLARRGWAIATLADIGSPVAVAMLNQLADHSVSDLNRLWLSAALLKTAPRTDILCNQFLKQPAESLRPVASARLETLLDATGDSNARTLIAASLKNKALKQLVDPMIVERGSTEIALACYPGGAPPVLGVNETQLRRAAAGYLAALAQSDPHGVAQATAKALQFDPNAETTPWGSAPLFLPSMQWSSSDAAIVYFQLARWWAKSGTTDSSVVQNNLRDLSQYFTNNRSDPIRSSETAICNTAFAISFAQAVEAGQQFGKDLSAHRSVAKWLESGQEPPRAYIETASDGLSLGWLVGTTKNQSSVVYWGERGIKIEQNDSRKVYVLADPDRQKELAGRERNSKCMTSIIDPEGIRSYGLYQYFGRYKALPEFRGHKDIEAGDWVYLYPSWYVFSN